MGRRRQRVVFRTDVSVVIDAPWADDCSIDQVITQATREARERLQKFRVESKDILITPEPKLIRVILDEDSDR